MRVPGAAWVGLIGFVIVWLQQYFDAVWVAGAVTALGAVAKLIEVYATSQRPVTPPDGPTPLGAPVGHVTEQPSKTARFFFG